MMFVTSFILTYLALSFYKMINSKEGHERKMRAQIQATLEAAQQAKEAGNTAFSKKYTFFLLSLNVGFREGMESIVFLIGVVSEVSDLSSLPIPIALALICSRMVGYCFFKGTNRMRVERFMKCSSLLLLFIAAGFFMGSIHKFQELTTAPFGDNSKKDGTTSMAWQNTPVWDWSDWANDVTDRFWVLMRALLGYQDKPTPLEFFAYGFYWIVVITAAVFIVRRVNKQMAARFGNGKGEEPATVTSEDKVNAGAAAVNTSEATTADPGSEAVKEVEASI
jgi:FTR1 family protein